MGGERSQALCKGDAVKVWLVSVGLIQVKGEGLCYTSL